MAKKQTEPLFPHLRYAILSDVREALTEIFLMWAIWSGLWFLAALGMSFIPLPENIKWQPPSWAVTTIIVMAGVWFARGKTVHVHFRVPMLSFGGWLAVSLYVSSVLTGLIVWELVPWWLRGPAFTAWVLFAVLLEDLNVRGRKNLDALKGSEELSESV